MIWDEKSVKKKLAEFLKEDPYHFRQIYDLLDADTESLSVFKWLIDRNEQFNCSPLELIRYGTGYEAVALAWRLANGEAV